MNAVERNEQEQIWATRSSFYFQEVIGIILKGFFTASTGTWGTRAYTIQLGVVSGLGPDHIGSVKKPNRAQSSYMKKGHKSRELRIPFDPLQQDLYRLQVKYKRKIPGCTIPLYPHLSGRGRQGEFPFMFVREYFRRRGY